MNKRPIYSAACPCCASTLVTLTTRTVARVWSCAYCGFAMMGLAVPISPFVPCGMFTCVEARNMTEVRR